MKLLYFAKLLFICIMLVGLSNSGYSQWTNDVSLNTPICVATGAQRDPKIESDNMGGAYIAWKDNRTGIPDIYLQHVDSNGVVQWTIDGIGACTEAADQSTPSLIIEDNGDVIITWSDLRSGTERDIYAQKIDVSGNILWTLDGVVVANQVEREHNEKICSDGAGGCFIVFEKEISPTYQWDIWIQHLDNNGNILWAAGGMPVVTTVGNKRNPKLQSDHSGGTYITWQDKRDSLEYDIYAQHITSNGTRLWGVNGLMVSDAAFDQTNPKMDPDVIDGGVYIAWVDDRNGDNDIYCQRIDSLGNIMWTPNGVAVCALANNQSAVDILSNSNVSGIILTWKDSRVGNTDIYAQRLDINGNPQWATNGIAVQNNLYLQLNPNIAGDGAGGAVICWQDSTASSEYDVMAQRINSSGIKLWNTNGTIVSNASTSQAGPKNTSDEHGGTIVTWEDFRNGPRDIYAQHINFDGSTGMEWQEQLIDLSVYPNPFIDQFNIELTTLNSQPFTMKMVNIIGEDATERIQTTSTIQNGKNHLMVNGELLSKGIYFLVISSGNGKGMVKLIKN